ncbi:MAG: WYL domain-containing protein [Bradymonadaceae bacterium]|nr:WYL domain-containing protein [Lujinxingiaceae bacterium]
MASDGPIQIPTIRGRIAERLRRAAPRNADADDELSFPDGPGDVLLRTPDERGVVALACLILENLREHGGTRASQRPLEAVLRKTLSTFGPKEVMDIEVEAYEMLLWIGSAIDPDWSAKAPGEAEEIASSSSQVELIRWAVAGNLDLDMDYYSRGRGELTHRRITPISLEAETYLHAYCHLRRDERVFRLSRIGDLRPIGGWPPDKKRRPKPENAAKERDQPEAGGAQMSLLDED